MMRPHILRIALLLLVSFLPVPCSGRRIIPVAASGLPHRTATKRRRQAQLISYNNNNNAFQPSRRARFYSVSSRYSQSRDSNERGSWSSRLLVINIIAFVAQTMYPSFTQWGIKLSDKILNGEQLYRLVTPMFLHGSIPHLLTNSYSLSSVGPQVERYFGSGRFLAAYVASGIAGNYLSAYRSPNPALGASGAVFGIVGAYFAFLVRNEAMFGGQAEGIQQALAQTIGINLIMGAMSPMIDQWGHVGGFAGGIGMAVLFGPRLSVVGLADGNSALVDDPILRLPRLFEAIPERVANRVDRIGNRMRVNQYLTDLPAKPWRENRSREYRRKVAPSRSVKPLPVR